MTEDQTGDTNVPNKSSIPSEVLKKAFKLFKKRIKLTRLDEESRIGRSAMSGGGKSGVMEIQPPNQYPKAVWDELVRQGKLRYVGHGLYEKATQMET